MLGVQNLGPVTPRRISEALDSGELGEGAGSQRIDCGRRRPEPRPALPNGGPRRSCGSPGVVAAERDAWVTLMGVTGLGPVTFASLLAAFGSALAVLEAASGPAGASRLREALADDAAGASLGEQALEEAPPGTEPERLRSGDRAAWTAASVRSGRRPALGVELAARICEAVPVGARTVELVRSHGLSVVTLDDAAYPARLRAVEMPPPLLFVRGSVASLNGGHAIAVVGTRRATDRGRLTAGWIASGLVRAGATIVSGLAVGIDGAAHAAVVGEGGVTVAVLGSGHARLFPRAHRRLAEVIVDSGGAVISEHPPETAASRGTFPRRNRVVSGLSDAVVIVEAGQRSGALITAGWALEQGRDCFLVPGAIDAPASAGCNAFLRAFPGGARVVCGIPELIEDLGLTGEALSAAGAGSEGVPSRGPSPAVSGAGAAAVLASLGPAERLVADLLSTGPATVDSLADRSDMSGAAVLSALTLLELRGLVAASYGRYLPAGALSRRPTSGRSGRDV